MNTLQKCAMSYFYDEYINEHDFETTLELSMDEETGYQFKKKAWFIEYNRQEIAQLIENLYEHMVSELGVQR